MPPRDPVTSISETALGGNGSHVRLARLAVLADVAQRAMNSREAAEVILSALESIAALAAYDYALLELSPGFGHDGSPTVFRATPQAIEAVAPSSILIDENAALFSLASGGRELGRLRVVASAEGLTAEEMAALRALAGYMS